MGKKPQQNTVIQQAPIAEPTPPVTQTSKEVVQAGMDLRQAQLLKKNIKSTVKAGDTGGFKPMGGPMKGGPVGAAGAGGKGYP